jgi:hypothetical protein
MSTNGTSLAMNDGRYAQWKPKRAVSATPVTISIASSTGEIAPPITKGSSANWTASAASARSRAAQTRRRDGLGLCCVVSIGAASKGSNDWPSADRASPPGITPGLCAFRSGSLKLPLTSPYYTPRDRNGHRSQRGLRAFDRPPLGTDNSPQLFPRSRPISTGLRRMHRPICTLSRTRSPLRTPSGPTPAPLRPRPRPPVWPGAVHSRRPCKTRDRSLAR